MQAKLEPVLPKPLPVEPDKLDCAQCSTIPASVSDSAEGRDYLDHYCDPECQLPTKPAGTKANSPH